VPRVEQLLLSMPEFRGALVRAGIKAPQ